MQYGRRNGKTGFLGVPTPAKASGAGYSFAAVLPVVLSVAFLAAVTAFGLTDDGYEKKDWFLYCSYCLPQIAFLAVAAWFLFYTKTPVKTEVTKQKCAPKYFLIAVLLQFGLVCLSELNSLFLKFLENFGYEDAGITLPSLDGFGFVGVLLVVAVLPAVMEEVMFRGVLLSGMRSWKTWEAALVCGALFSLYHQNPAQTLYQFCCGAAFAWVAIRSGSILPTVLSHFLNNAAILILTKCGVESYPTPVYIAVNVLSAICLIGVAAYLILTAKRERAPETQSEERAAERKRFWQCALVGVVVCVISWISVLVSGL